MGAAFTAEAFECLRSPEAVWKPLVNLKIRPVKFADVLNAEVNMPRYIESQDRQQVMLLPECLGGS
ncbi:hypothetical protein CR156_05160 [Stenotrophomonas lactitubi]|nr:hypothetical protein CR156_05160 [Stenotrophomonas lactitubi]